ncbi:hypothetical protein L2E82_46436 [Cichorium intybus]|uniref:Uncharacterized protein n=1 Tax=Cichorium intybus TaxID=13427 RepID=A0ACB8YSG7_CICIN|nr:hypothetical protein L2E82_46436 [Cichorium intybus]
MLESEPLNVKEICLASFSMSVGNSLTKVPMFDLFGKLNNEEEEEERELEPSPQISVRFLHSCPHFSIFTKKIRAQTELSPSPPPYPHNTASSLDKPVVTRIHDTYKVVGYHLCSGNIGGTEISTSFVFSPGMPHSLF